MSVAARVAAVVLILVGFVLAGLSHPIFHSMSVSSDKVIDRLLLSGVTCTFFGILALILAIRGLDRRTKQLWLIPAFFILATVSCILLFRFFY